MTIDPRLQRLLGGEALAGLRKRLRQRYQRGASTGVLRLGALSEADHAALAALAGRPARHVRSMQIDVAEITSIDVSTISRLVTRLVTLGLVTRTRSDTNNREVNVELSATGRTLVNMLIPRARALEDAAIAGIPSADLAITRETLRRMYDTMSAEAAGAAPAPEKLAKSG